MAPDDPTLTPDPGPVSSRSEDGAATPGPDPGSTLLEDSTTAVLEPPTTSEDLTLARWPDLTSLVAGIALMALGVLLVLESEGVLELSLGYLWPALLAAAGAALLASGVRRRRGR